MARVWVIRQSRWARKTCLLPTCAACAGNAGGEGGKPGGASSAGMFPLAAGGLGTLGRARSALGICVSILAWKDSLAGMPGASRLLPECTITLGLIPTLFMDPLPEEDLALLHRGNRKLPHTYMSHLCSALQTVTN